MNGRELALRLGLRAAWTVGPHIPDVVARTLRRVGAPVAIGTGLATPAQWRRNAAVVLGRPPTRRETTAAVASYLRYWLELVALPGWDPATIDARVRCPRLGELQQDLADAGCVVALAHLGNWDLAGAFACQHGLPVASVAEVLPGPAFGEFLAHRERLGFRIRGHRDAGLVHSLVADARERRLVCLLGDRDLRGSGVPVRWGTATGARDVTMPAGPALVAQRSGAHLRGLTTHYEGDVMVIDISDRIPVAPGTAGVRAATQAVADVLSSAVAEHVVDWHVFQPFFEPRP